MSMSGTKKPLRAANARRGSLGGSLRVGPGRKGSGEGSGAKAMPKHRRNASSVEKTRRGSVSDVLLKQCGVEQKMLDRPKPVMQAIGSFDKDEGNGWSVMEDLLKAKKEINMSAEISPDDAARTIIKETCQLLQADRSTLFFVDAEAQELILIIAKGANNIRIPIGNGLAGDVAATGKPINIADAYEDSRFTSNFDKVSGYRTRAVLAVPVWEPNGDIVAVLQCINKVPNGRFSHNDQVLLEHMADHVGTVLSNAKTVEAERSAKMKVASVLDVVKMLHSSSTNTNSLIFTLSNRAHELVDADRCTLYLADIAKAELVVMQGDLDFRFSNTKGLAGFVARTGKALVIDDAYKDARFNKSMDMQSGYRTKSLLCMPIFGAKKGADGRPLTIGVLQLINKMDDAEVFTVQDLELMEILLNIAGPILEKSKFFENQKAKVSKEIQIVPKKSPRVGTRTLLAPPSLSTFGEEEEEDDF